MDEKQVAVVGNIKIYIISLEWNMWCQLSRVFILHAYLSHDIINFNGHKDYNILCCGISNIIKQIQIIDRHKNAKDFYY